MATNNVWNSGTLPLAIAMGGTSAATKQAAFDALSPLTTQGDVLYYNGTNNVALGESSVGKVLVTQGASANPKWSDNYFSIADGKPTGNYIVTCGPQGLCGAGIGAAVTPAVDQILYLPFWLNYTTTVLTLNTYCITGQASKNLNMAIFTSTSDNSQPSTIVANTTSGSISLTSGTSLKTYSINGGSGVSLNPGIYWFAHWRDSSTATFNGQVAGQEGRISVSTIGNTTNQVQLGFIQTSTYGTTFPAVGSLSYFNTTNLTNTITSYIGI